MMEEKIVVGAGTKYPLDGLLTLPTTGEAPFPAVVLVHGSGASDMDSNIKKVRPFKDIAHGLADHGIATIRYNKRTWSHYGRKEFKLLEQQGVQLTVKEETVEDAILAANLLKADKRIDAKRVFIAGLSMGAMLAPRIDVDGGDFAGLILMAGSPRRLEEAMMSQQDEFLANSKGFIKWLAGKQIAKVQQKWNGIYDKTDDEVKAIPFMGGTTMYYFKEMGQKTVAEYLAESGKPVLVMHPEKDLQVSLEKDFNKYKTILADRDNATFKLYPGLNHVFMPAVADKVNHAMKEFAIDRPVEPYVIDDIAAWIKGV
jgi:dienelactone hydrolase